MNLIKYGTTVYSLGKSDQTVALVSDVLELSMLLNWLIEVCCRKSGLHHQKHGQVYTIVKSVRKVTALCLPCASVHAITCMHPSPPAQTQSSCG